MIENLSKSFHAFTKRMMISLSVDEMFLQRYMNISTDFSDLPLRVVMAPFCLKHVNSVLFAFTIDATLKDE